MRRPWIKVETATPDKPEICHLATSLRLDADAVLGKLVRLWSWIEVNRLSGKDLGVTKEFLDKLVGRKGFAAALSACGWLIETEGKIGLNNLERHNGGRAKDRALTALRVARHRQRKQSVATKSLESSNEKEVMSDDILASKDSAKNVDNDSDSLEIKDLQNINGLKDGGSVMANLSPPSMERASSWQATESDVPQPISDAEPVLETKDLPPVKRRHRTATETPDQPMLF